VSEPRIAFCRCGHLRGRQEGWTRDVATGVWVCGRCRLPSRLVAERLQHSLFALDRVKARLLR